MMKKHIILFSSVLVFGVAGLTVGGSEVRAEEAPIEAVADGAAVAPDELNTRVEAKADFYDNNSIGYKVTNATAKEVTITTHYFNGLSENVVIPEKVTNGGVEYTVVEIAASAMGLLTLTNVGTLESDTVKTVIIPKTVKVIGQAAFYNRKQLDSVNLSEGLVTIGTSAFRATGIKSIVLPDTVVTIGEQAFMEAASLVSINIPKNVKTIGNFTFQDCTSLTGVNLPSSLTSIGNSAFRNTTSLKTMVVPNSVKTIGHYAFAEATSLSSVTLPAELDTLSNYLFYNCKSLKKINIPDSVTTFVGNVFKGSGLTDVTLPKSISSGEKLGFESFYVDYLEVINFTSAFPEGMSTNVFKEPIKDGYTFDGWSGSDGETYQQNELSKPAKKGNITLTAKWKQGPETPKPSTGISDATIKLLEKQEEGAVSFGAIATDAKMVFKEITLDGKIQTTEEGVQTSSKVKVTDTRINKNTGWKVGVNYKDTNYIDKKMNLTLKGTSTNAAVVSNVSIDKTKKNLFTGGTAKAGSYEVKLNPTLTIPADFKATGNQTTQIEWTLEMDVQ